jgi:hypothetical protein
VAHGCWTEGSWLLICLTIPVLCVKEQELPVGCRASMLSACATGACLAVEGTPRGHRGRAVCAVLPGKVAGACVHDCFAAVVNINKTRGARPSGRPGLPRWGGMEIMLCTLDRASNPAPRDTWHDFCS